MLIKIVTIGKENKMGNLSQKEIQAILQLSGPKRYSHFIKKSVGNDEIWILYKGKLREGEPKEGDLDGELGDGQYALLGNDESHAFLSLWPAEEYAHLCRIDGWEDFQPVCIGIEEFLVEYLPHFMENKINMCVFMTPNALGVTPPTEVLVRDLGIELSLYE